MAPGRLKPAVILLTISLVGLGFAQANAGVDAVDPCPEIEVDELLEERYPTYKYRCIGTDAFVKDGRELGFTDDPPIDWVRPGMNIAGCTTSFLLTDDDGGLYLTTSGHCVLVERGFNYCDSTYANTTTLGASLAEGYGEARVAYTSGEHMQAVGATQHECDSYDFAIIEIPEELHDVTHPMVRHVGGPTDLIDPLTLRHRDPMVGYGNSNDRGFAWMLATGTDHGYAPTAPFLNTFRGYYAGHVFAEAYCLQDELDLCGDAAGDEESGFRGLHGYRQYARYGPSKIMGDSGSGDMTWDGAAVGVTTDLNLVTALNGFIPVYDALLKIHVELGDTYYLVTWDDWNPLPVGV